MDSGLQGRVVLVTGGSSGLGAAAAERLLGEGANVAICGRDPERLRVTADRLTADHLSPDRHPAHRGELLAVPADVTVPNQLSRFVDAAVARWSRIDALVNNAGTGGARPFESITDEQWQADLDLWARPSRR